MTLCADNHAASSAPRTSKPTVAARMAGAAPSGDTPSASAPSRSARHRVSSIHRPHLPPEAGALLPGQVTAQPETGPHHDAVGEPAHQLVRRVHQRLQGTAPRTGRVRCGG
ncbi:hypothetical protein ACFV9U_36535, partial [Streptomyces sp. NPDC059876]|uniref:hypothetical protein n=1 Tax=Streptomyces sp. NPDC059876 TaxID=3346985 RepID=UPI00365D2C4E